MPAVSKETPRHHVGFALCASDGLSIAHFRASATRVPLEPSAVKFCICARNLEICAEVIGRLVMRRY